MKNEKCYTCEKGELIKKKTDFTQTFSKLTNPLF